MAVSPATETAASDSAGHNDMTPERMRALMPITERVAYFDHSAVSPLSGPAAAAMGKWLKEAAELGDTVWPSWAAQVQATRKSAAKLIGAESSEIVLVPNTTAGMTYVAEGIDWREGDNIVTLAGEYPSNVYPWMHQKDRGVETRLVPTDRGKPDLAKLKEACDSRTRLVSVSWVGFATGYRLDPNVVCEIAHDAGALFFLDAIQGLGVFPLDVRDTPIDFLAADGHKWMLGPEGAGMAYIRQEHLENLRPIGVGAASVVNAHDYSTIDFRLRDEASRYEGGSKNISGLIAWGASLELLMAWPPGKAAEAVLAITDLACERLKGIGAEIISHREIEPGGHDPRSGVVSFAMPGQDPMELRKRCLEANVALSCRDGRLRLAAHAYNNADDVDRLIEVLK